jgi:hypothetical protein
MDVEGRMISKCNHICFHLDSKASKVAIAYGPTGLQDPFASVAHHACQHE